MAKEPSHIEAIMTLLSGKMSPQSGSFTIDGNERETYERDYYYQKVAYVSDSAILYPGSLLQNLSNFNEELETNVADLCVQLGIHQEIERLPYGYKTEVNSTENPPLERGAVQTIALIRAFVQSPSILLLNRADAGLDLERQKNLVELLGAQKGLTVIARTATELLKEYLTPHDLQKEVKEVHHA